MPTKDEYIEKLNLTPHPEGGWYRQVYHSAKTHYDATSLASRYEYTSIYFILDGARHRICTGCFMMNYGISMMARQLSSTAFIRMAPMRPYI